MGIDQLNNNYKDVMLDFETLGNGVFGGVPAICQVGACYFDKDTGQTGKEFKANIDADSHVRLGGQLDAKTIYWWLQQSDAARNSINVLAQKQDPVYCDVSLVMTQLNEFLKDAKRIWSHATFDFVILTKVLAQCQITPSFSYKAGMDIRTLVYLSGITMRKTERTGTHHDALEDCKHQVKYTVAALNLLK